MKNNKALMPFFALILATTATAQPTAQTLTVGETYYIYNVKQQQYLADDGNGTLTLSSAGMPITITVSNSDGTTDDGIYFMTGTKGKLGSSFLDADVKTDGTGQYDHWRITPVEEHSGEYMISCRFRETAAFSYLYWGALSQRLIKAAIMPGFDYEYGHWILVSKSDYEGQIITLDEAATSYSQPTVTATDGATVRLKRTLTLNSWNTFCVPFDIDATQLKNAFGDVKVAKFDKSDDTTLYFTTVQSVESGQLYLIYPTKSQLDGGYYEFTGIKSFDAGQAAAVSSTSVTAYPFYYQTTAPAKAYVIRKNLVYHLTSDMTMNGFRAYFVENASEGKLSNWLLDGTTQIDQTLIDGSDDSNAPIYNLSGQRIGNPAQKGVYIKNGKKVIIK